MNQNLCGSKSALRNALRNKTACDITCSEYTQGAGYYSATTNRITTSGYAYDASGNMTNDTLNTYTYDAEGRIKAVGGTSTAAYTYDGAGLRVKKEVPSVSPTTTTRYIYSGTKVIAEYENGAAVGSPTKEYIYAGGQLVATLNSSGTPTYHQRDHLSVRVNTDTSGAKVGDQGHYPFGEEWYKGSGGTKWQFTSYERDSESGLDYATFRYDSTRLGRFMTPDPIAGSIANPQSFNRYAYVQNNPINFVDPLGLLCAYYVWMEEVTERVVDGVWITEVNGHWEGFFCGGGGGNGGGGSGVFSGHGGHGSSGDSCSISGGFSAGILGTATATGGLIIGGTVGGSAGPVGGYDPNTGDSVSYATVDLTSSTFNDDYFNGTPDVEGNVYFGFFVGAGADFLFSFGNSPQQVSGRGRTTSLDVGLGLVGFGVSYTVGENGVETYTVNPNLGVGLGFQVSSTNTTTHVEQPAGCRE